ncbi:MAG: hypothetical protein MJ252_05040 [archaeon]|nr:hypothetical protein [archaeon]MCQ2816617.1 hypothetical protein [archaeon]
MSKPEIKKTTEFGWVHGGSKSFDDLDQLPDPTESAITSIVAYLKTKKKTEEEINAEKELKRERGEDEDQVSEKKQIITDIFFKYKNLLTGQQITPREIRDEERDEESKTFELDNDEYLTNMGIKVDMEISGITFYTNKDRWIEFGQGNGTQMNINLNPRRISLIAAFGSFNGGSLESFGMYYFPRVNFFKNRYNSLFELKRAFDRDEDYKDKVESEVINYDDADKAAVRVASLPKNQFLKVMHYLVHK